MYQDSNMLASIRKVEAAREENAKLDPRRMTAEEKDKVSHRGNALRLFKEELKKYI